MKKSIVVLAALAGFTYLQSCNSSTSESEDMNMSMSEEEMMEGDAGSSENAENTSEAMYSETAYISEFPLADTIIKYSSEGRLNAKLTDEMARNANMLVENLGADASVLQYGEGVIVALDQGNVFESDQFTLNDNSKDILRRLAFNLKQMPDTYILVAGRADKDGAADHNDELAYKRAAMAANYLHGCGIPEERFFVDSYGEKYPDYRNDSRLNKGKNRRVDFLIIPSNSLREQLAEL